VTARPIGCRRAAVPKAESGGWKLAAAQLALYTGTAYVLTVALVQGLRALGVP
jgi:hypothetical protein